MRKRKRRDRGKWVGGKIREGSEGEKEEKGRTKVGRRKRKRRVGRKWVGRKEKSQMEAVRRKRKRGEVRS